MKECIICKQDAGMFAKKAYNGCVCKACRQYLPMHIDLKSCDADYLIRLVEQAKEKAKIFSNTSSYGTMYLDSVHSMFCFSKNEKNGEPTDLGDIFSIAELKETGIYCADIRNIGTNTNKVVCNVKVKVVTDNVATEYIAAENEPCEFTKKDKMLDVTEPKRLTMFRSLFYQMIDDTRFQILKKLQDIQKLKEMEAESVKKKTATEQDMEWARGVLFLENKDCSPDEIKKQQKKLMRMFHPDIHPELGDDYAKKINKATEILLREK